MAISNQKLAKLIREFFAMHHVELSDIPGVCAGYTSCAITAAFLGKDELRRFYQRMVLLKAYEDKPAHLCQDIVLAQQKVRQINAGKLDILNAREELLAELPIFFQTLWLYQTPTDFYSALGKHTVQSFYKIHPFVAPKLLAAPIQKLHRSYLAISQEKLFDYLCGLEKILKRPQVMMISNGYHRYAVIYHASSKHWSVLDILRKDSELPRLDKLTVSQMICGDDICVLRIDFMSQAPCSQLQKNLEKLDIDCTRPAVFSMTLRGVNLLYLAYKINDTETIIKLEESGAKLPLERVSIVIIDIAAELGRVETMRWFISQCLFPMAYKQRFFNIACAYGHQSLCELLLNDVELGININYENDKGVSALFIAAKHGRDSLCLWLIEQGASMHCRKAGRFIDWLKRSLNNHSLASEVEARMLKKSARALRSLNGCTPFCSTPRGNELTRQSQVNSVSLSGPRN